MPSELLLKLPREVTRNQEIITDTEALNSPQDSLN